jgi:dihydrofolate synthase / folylpolyglutamate synthase
MDPLSELLEWTATGTRRAGVEGRLPRLLGELGPARYPRIIKVAGTNGKGSTAAMLEALLSRRQTVGLFTSPHLQSVTERIRINGVDVESLALQQQARTFLRDARLLVREQGGWVHPTFFDALIIIALRIWHARGVKWAVVEAGKGGSYDATSALPDVLGAITTVGVDHIQELGPSISRIAYDKAGIVIEGSQLVLGPDIQGEALTYIARRSTLRRVALIQTSWDDVREATSSRYTSQAEVRWLDRWHRVTMSLIGRHQLGNLLVATKMLECLVNSALITPAPMLDGHLPIRWPGRFEVVRDERFVWVLDVAHNHDAFVALKKTLDQFWPFEKRILLIGMTQDHAIPLTTAGLKSIAPRVWATSGFHRAMDAEQWSTFLPCVERFFERPALALTALREELASNDVPVVAGSVFLIGAVRQLLYEGGQ